MVELSWVSGYWARRRLSLWRCNLSSMNTNTNHWKWEAKLYRPSRLLQSTLKLEMVSLNGGSHCGGWLVRGWEASVRSATTTVMTKCGKPRSAIKLRSSSWCWWRRVGKRKREQVPFQRYSRAQCSGRPTGCLLSRTISAWNISNQIRVAHIGSKPGKLRGIQTRIGHFRSGTGVHAMADVHAYTHTLRIRCNYR